MVSTIESINSLSLDDNTSSMMSAQCEPPTKSTERVSQEGQPKHESTSSQLEDLPWELKSQILGYVDLQSLSNLIHASPQFHAQYQPIRDEILRSCVEREFGGFFIDAYALLKAQLHEMGQMRTNDDIERHLGHYKGWVEEPTTQPNAQSIDPDSLRWLSQNYLSVIRPYAQKYTQWALSNFGDADASLATPLAELSRSEQIRVFRAVYRYETYYRLFGSNDGQREGIIRRHRVNDIFYGIFQTWESEAIGCFELFMRHQFDQWLGKAVKNLRSGTAKFRKPKNASKPSRWYDPPMEQKRFVDRALAKGLLTASRLLSIANQGEIISVIEDCLLSRKNCYDKSLAESQGCAAQFDRRQMHHHSAAVHQRPRNKTICFSGDTETLDGPPLGWVLLWNEKYSNVYGPYVPGPLRQWGFVMWDAARLEKMGVKDLIYKQWETSPKCAQAIEDDFHWNPVREMERMPWD